MDDLSKIFGQVNRVEIEDRIAIRRCLRPVMRFKREMAKGGWNWGIMGLMAAVVIFWILVIAAIAGAEVVVDMAAIAQIESSGNPNAWNKRDDSRGLYQIREIAFQDYLQYHPSSPLTFDDMWSPVHNATVAEWMFSVRIPQLLKHYDLPETTLYTIAVYNFGIGNVIKWHKSGGRVEDLPEVTQSYYKKYARLTQ